jgi:selenide,water dikinase
VAGLEPPEAAAIPVAEIARAAGLTVRIASVTHLDPANRTLALSNGEPIHWDLLSFDVGSLPAGLSVPGAREHAFPMRPFSVALEMIARLDAACADSAPGAEVPVVVVGAGAAGVEIALAVRARIARAGRAARVTIIDAAATDGLPLAGFAQASRESAHRALTRRGISVLGGTVTSVSARTVTVDVKRRAEELESVATAWVSGPAAHPWFAESGVACDRTGFPYVSDTLALDAGETMFGGGDCVALRHAPATAKAGVYAVRMAPVLAANVLAVARGAREREIFTPQADFLALLSTGDGRAILRWRGVAVESRWAQWLKTRIDEAYLRRYRALAP